MYSDTKGVLVAQLNSMNHIHAGSLKPLPTTLPSLCPIPAEDCKDIIID